MAGQMKLGEGEVRKWRQGRGLSSEVSLAGRSQGGEEDRGRHAGYVIIIVEQRGRLFSALNTRAERQVCKRVRHCRMSRRRRVGRIEEVLN